MPKSLIFKDKRAGIFLALFVFICAAFVSLLPHHALAGQMSVFPLRVEFPAGKTGETLNIRNVGKEAISIQPTVMRWTQVDGEDKFEATRDVLVAPALVEIPPGETQVIRLALRRAPDAAQQLTYRVFVREVPKQTPSAGATVNILLNLSLPIFIPAANSSAQKSSFSVAANPNGMGFSITNPGNSHIQFKELTVRDNAGTTNQTSSMFYLLGQQTKTISFPANAKRFAGPIQATAKTDQGDLSSQLAR